MNNKKYKIRVILNKKGNMRYFSQLDLLKIIERAMRRAQLPLYFTQGFNPHPKMSFGRALKVGREGKIEVSLYFKKDILPPLLKKTLSEQFPLGLEIVKVEKII